MDRLEFHSILVDILGSTKVYYQPPSTIQMKYPCIIYAKSSMDTKHADDDKYLNTVRYTVTVVDSNPDSDIAFKLHKLQYSKFNRHYTSDNLNHDVFDIYY